MSPDGSRCSRTSFTSWPKSCGRPGCAHDRVRTPGRHAAATSTNRLLKHPGPSCVPRFEPRARREIAGIAVFCRDFATQQSARRSARGDGSGFFSSLLTVRSRHSDAQSRTCSAASVRLIIMQHRTARPALPARGCYARRVRSHPRTCLARSRICRPRGGQATPAIGRHRHASTPRSAWQSCTPSAGSRAEANHIPTGASPVGTAVAR